MTIIAAFTKKHLSEITRFENTIDKEYRLRMENITSKEELFRLLDDYEEFLPSGIQKFRGCDDEEFGELLFQIRRIYNMAKRERKMPAEANEAVVIVSPPLLGRIRVLALMMAKTANRPFTWGEAFAQFKANGDLNKMLENQEKLYRHIIKIKEKIKDLQEVK
jgi:hypothetical protein